MNIVGILNTLDISQSLSVCKPTEVDEVLVGNIFNACSCLLLGQKVICRI